MEEILHKAEQLEKDYDWLGAAELYEKALGMAAKEDFLKLGMIQEEIGRCLYFASMQVESRDSKRERGKLLLRTERLKDFMKIFRMSRKAGGFFVANQSASISKAGSLTSGPK